jgi:exopolysaccharide production protein ExoZ
MHITSAPRARRGTLQLIQVFRGAAATMVMLYHVTNVNHFHFPFLGNAFGFGHSGIDFFFVLSGFIMLYVHYEKGGHIPTTRAAWRSMFVHARRTGRFLAMRAIRIFPIYWCVLAVTVAAFWMYPPTADNVWAPLSTLQPKTLVQAVFLTNPDMAIVVVAWTLTYEVIFYVFFSLYILCGARAFAVLALAWCGAIGAQWNGVAPWPHPILLRPLVAEFFLGCLAAVLVKRFGPKNMSGWWVLVVVALCAAVARAELVGAIDAYRWYWAPYFLLILVGAAYDQATRRSYPRLPVLLGEASYSIYLIHYGMIALFAETIGPYRSVASKAPNITLALLALTILTAGVLVHWGVEQPLLTSARRHIGQ